MPNRFDPPIGMYPVAVIEDRYGGAYSGGRWLAVASFGLHVDEIWDGPHGGDCEAMRFGDSIPSLAWVAVGSSPDEAYEALLAKHVERTHGMSKDEAAHGEGLQ